MIAVVSTFLLLLASQQPRAAAQFTSPQSQEGTVVFEMLVIDPKERLTAFRMTCKPCSIIGAADLPPGWNSTISQDSDGKCIFSSEAISSQYGVSLNAWERVRWQIINRTFPGKELELGGSYEVSRTASTTKLVPLNEYEFRFIEKFPRRRLSP